MKERTKRTLKIVGITVGGVAVAGGVALYCKNRRLQEENARLKGAISEQNSRLDKFQKDNANLSYHLGRKSASRKNI